MLSIVKVQRWPVLIKILLVLGATNGLLVRVGVISVTAGRMRTNVTGCLANFRWILVKPV
jgi:hypothetical protein